MEYIDIFIDVYIENRDLLNGNTLDITRDLGVTYAIEDPLPLPFTLDQTSVLKNLKVMRCGRLTGLESGYHFAHTHISFH